MSKIKTYRDVLKQVSDYTGIDFETLKVIEKKKDELIRQAFIDNENLTFLNVGQLMYKKFISKGGKKVGGLTNPEGEAVYTRGSIKLRASMKKRYTTLSIRDEQEKD